MNSYRSVGRTGPARDHAHAWSVGQLAMGFSHISRTALLPASDELDFVLTGMQAVEYGQITFTRYAKGMGNALGNEAVNEYVAGKL